MASECLLSISSRSKDKQTVLLGYSFLRIAWPMLNCRLVISIIMETSAGYYHSVAINEDKLLKALVSISSWN